MPHEPEPDLRGARVHDPDFARLPVSAVRTSGGGIGTRWGFLPRWQLEAAYGSSSGLFLITMVNVLVVSGCHGRLSAPEFTALRFRKASQSRLSPLG
jgi:hypothetical protein